MKIWQRFLMGFGNDSPIKIRIKCFKLAGIKIGLNPDISFGFYADRPEGITIGDNCFFNHFIHLHNGNNKSATISFGNNVYIGPESRFICATHEIGKASKRAGRNKYGSIIVEDGVWIGAGATILPVVKIARGGVIGAGAVVTKSTEPNGLYLGVPAKRVRDLEV